MQIDGSRDKQSLLVLLRLDATNLMTKIKERNIEFISEFSLKRTREHFKDIFFTRYFDLSAKDLIIFSEDLIVSMHEFYTEAENLKWYLNHTQDMTVQVTENVDHKIKNLEKYYNKLLLFFEGENLSE